MAQISEAGPDPSQLNGALRDGQDGLPQHVHTFQVYYRAVLPLDGFLFWVPAHTEDIKGLLHYTQQIVQNEDETYGQATANFSTITPLVDFAKSPAERLFVTALEDGTRFAFNTQQGRFDPAGLWHYSGRSIPPALATQLLDRPGSIDPDQTIVSNSLPLWLALNAYQSPFYDGFSLTGTPFKVAPPTLFPSDLVPANQLPPYGTVRITENDTETLQVAPRLDANRNHHQLCKDRVRITLYGLQRNAGLDFQDTVNQYSVNTGNFGIMNMVVVSDTKRTQPELETIAMKKVITYEINYDQYRLANVARQLILSCVPRFLIARGV